MNNSSQQMAGDDNVLVWGMSKGPQSYYIGVLAVIGFIILKDNHFNHNATEGTTISLSKKEEEGTTFEQFTMDFLIWIVMKTTYIEDISIKKSSTWHFSEPGHLHDISQSTWLFSSNNQVP